MNIENGVTTGMYKSDTVGGVQPEAGDGPGPFLMGTKTLISNEVVDREAGALGKITEIMLDVLSGRVAYAVLSFGGFLGLGEKLFAVPWSALVLDTMNKRFMLDVKKSGSMAPRVSTRIIGPIWPTSNGLRIFTPITDARCIRPESNGRYGHECPDGSGPSRLAVSFASGPVDRSRGRKTPCAEGGRFRRRRLRAPVGSSEGRGQAILPRRDAQRRSPP